MTDKSVHTGEGNDRCGVRGSMSFPSASFVLFPVSSFSLRPVNRLEDLSKENIRNTPSDMKVVLIEDKLREKEPRHRSTRHAVTDIEVLCQESEELKPILPPRLQTLCHYLHSLLATTRLAFFLVQ